MSYDQNLADCERALAAMTAERDCERAVIEGLRSLSKATLPCGHNQQYGFTKDGGKTIVCLQCEAERLAQIEALAVALTKKLRECEPYISGAFMLSTVHGMAYQGPSYGKDLEALEAALLPVRGAGEEG